MATPGAVPGSEIDDTTTDEQCAFCLKTAITVPPYCCAQQKKWHLKIAATEKPAFGAGPTPTDPEDRE